MSSERKQAVIGQVLSPHGVTGQVKVFPYSDFPERISLLKEVELVTGFESVNMIVEKASVHGRFWLIKFQGVDSRDQAYRLSGALMQIPLEERVSLPENNFYHDQLVGLKVYDSADQLLGRVVDVVETGGHDIIIVQPAGEDEKNFMIPAVKSIVRKVDLSAGSLLVELPEGLLDL